MDSRGTGEQCPQSLKVAGTPTQRGRHGLGEAPLRVRQAVAELARRGKALVRWHVALIVAYLVAITAANLIAAWLGPRVTPITAFLFIGLDITTRDHLHEAWRRRGLVWKMGLLIVSGSIISWLLNRNAGRIAFASFVAFAASSAIDTLVYHAVRRSKFERVNWSNLASAAVDSVLFPSLAFGWPPSMEIVYGQSTAKIAGGLFWSLILRMAQPNDGREGPVSTQPLSLQR